MAQQEQKALLKEQDQELDKLGAGVQRVKALAKVMNTEISEQNVILDSLEDDIDKTDSNMQSMQKKLKGMVEDAKNSDRALWSVIACLSILLAVLVVMVLS